MKRNRAGLLPLMALLVCSFAADGDAGAGGGGTGTQGGRPGGGTGGGASGGSQGGGQQGGGQQQPDPFTQAVTSVGLPGGAVSGFRNFLAQHGGNALNAAAALYDDNHALRTNRRELSNDQMIEKLRAAGLRVLTKEEAAAHDAFVATGKKPEELTTIITEHGALTREKQEREADKVLDAAAQTHGYKPGAIFRSFVKANNLAVEAGTKKVLDPATNAEKDAPAYFVVTKDAQGKETSRKALDEYLRENFRDDEAALPRADVGVAGAAGAGNVAGTGAGQHPQWVQQPAGGAQQQGGVNPAASYLGSQYAHVMEAAKPAGQQQQ
jgi:hypothetical protein